MNRTSTTAGLEILEAVVPNFRDAGGLATASGRPMRTSVIYRSSSLFDVSEAAQEALLAIGVSDVFDLRTTAEVAHRPDTLPPAITLTVDDVLADRPHSGAAGVTSLINDHVDRASIDDINASIGGGGAKATMLETYRHLVMLPSAHRGYRRLLTSITSSAGASVIHCTAGKDRTGWAIVVLQLVAGAGMDDILDDYLLSNEPMRRAYGPMMEAFAAEGGDAESLAHMMLVEPGYLDEALTLMRAQFGGLEGYLVTGLGMETSEIDLLRARLVS
ncbi:MAG: tyrosine-protein phosphatase [Actinobacteria bacterium]|nr:tyrosine-protein phosphatase [Actinomycetota bacterium]